MGSTTLPLLMPYMFESNTHSLQTYTFGVFYLDWAKEVIMRWEVTRFRIFQPARKAPQSVKHADREETLFPRIPSKGQPFLED